MAYAAVISLSKTLRLLRESDHQFSNYPKPQLVVIKTSVAEFSLSKILRQMQDSVLESSNTPNYPKSQIETLQNGVDALKDFLEVNPEIKSGFETRIIDAIYEAEDIIDFHISSEAEISSSFCQDLERVTEKINSIVEMMREEFNHLTLDRQIRSLSWREYFNCSAKKYPLVGRSEDLIQLKDRLMTESPELQVVPIVGIRGMGKTALAQHVFKDLSIRELFGIACWVKLPIEYRKRDVLLGLLESLKKRADGFRHMTDDQLAKHVYNALKNKKYLVVLDDVRDIAVWNDLKEVLPDYNNGSRILVTTRNMDAVWNAPHQLDRLSDEDTLALLGSIAFSDEPCPPELLVITKDIVESCRGFPLAAVIVGRLFVCAKLSAENLEIVLSSIITSEKYVDLTEAVVSLTYRHLPQDVKTCLLYMALFPYGGEISGIKLLDLLKAEGFIQGDSLYNLVQLRRRGLVYDNVQGGKFRIDEEVFYEFLVRKAEEDNFFLIIDKNPNGGFLQENNTYNQQRRLCIQKSIYHVIKDLSEYNISESLSTIRSLFYMGPEHQYPLRSWFDFKLLKVLHAPKIRLYTFPPEILILFQLRYLVLSYNGELPVEVCNLRNLRILIVLHYLSVKRSRAPSYLPMEIWNMKELRHLQVMGSDLPDISLDSNLLLEKLSTLSNVGAHSCNPCILEKLRHLQRLGVRIESPISEDDSSLSFFSHLKILDDLKKFKCVVMYPDMGYNQVVPSTIPVFPSGLWKLSLSGCGFPWEYMRSIAILSNLRWLKLRSYAFRGLEWDVKKDDFSMLKFLLLEDMDLEKWILANGSFPELESLTIRHCYKLQEFPSEFADIATLRTIEVEDCNPPVMDSAQKINKNRKDLECGQIEVDLYSSLDD